MSTRLVLHGVAAFPGRRRERGVTLQTRPGGHALRGEPRSWRRRRKGAERQLRVICVAWATLRQCPVNPLTADDDQGSRSNGNRQKQTFAQPTPRTDLPLFKLHDNRDSLGRHWELSLTFVWSISGVEGFGSPGASFHRRSRTSRACCRDASRT